MLNPGPHEEFRATLGGSTLVAYLSGAVVYHPELVELVEAALTPPHGTELGSDEAGKGESEGPLAVAAVALDPPAAVRLRARGLAETKSISRSALPRIASEIEEEALSVAVRLVTVSEFRRVWSRGNLNDLLTGWHLEVLEEAAERAGRVDIIAVDSFDERRLTAALRPLAERLGAELVVVPGADSRFPSVAAASVVARVARERAMAGGRREGAGRKW